MHIRTPKRYRGAQRRSVFPFRRFLLMALVIIFIVAGVAIYQLRDLFQADVIRAIEGVANNIGQSVSTLGAPTPTPTQNPANNLVSGDNAWSLGSASEALRQYKPILASLPNDLTVHYRATLASLSLGKVQEALTYAEKTVTADPFSSDAWAIRAWALVENGRNGEALASALHARELDEKNMRAWVQLARAYFAQGQNTRAQSAIEEALTLDPDSYEAYWVRGQIREEGLFEFQGALSDYQTAYDIARIAQPIVAGAIAVDIAQQQALRNQDYTGAIATLKGVLETNPENALALFWLGTVYFSYQGDPPQAAVYLQKCVDENPDSYNCAYLLGRAQFSQGYTREAAESFNRAVELKTPFARHYWWAANAQFSIGDCASAGIYLQEGLKLVDSNTPQDLRDAYDYLISTCNLNLGARSIFAPTATPTPEPSPAGTENDA